MRYAVLSTQSPAALIPSPFLFISDHTILPIYPYILPIITPERHTKSQPNPPSLFHANNPAYPSASHMHVLQPETPKRKKLGKTRAL